MHCVLSLQFRIELLEQRTTATTATEFTMIKQQKPMTKKAQGDFDNRPERRQ